MDGAPLAVAHELGLFTRYGLAVELQRQHNWKTIHDKIIHFELDAAHAPGMLPPGAENKVMHASLRIGDSTVMASDGQCLGRPNFQGFALSLPVSNDVEAERLFAALGDGGKVCMPLAKTFFSSRFGMVADRFGVSWMIIVAQ